MSNIKVSVIVPNYNHAQHLSSRVDSVLQQTFNDIEVIILDDCSTDDSNEVIEKYRSHPKVTHIVINEMNTGSPFLQWRRGLALANGDWIWIAESDDVAHRRFLERLLQKANSDVGLIYCDSFIVRNDRVMDETFATIKNRMFNTDRWSADYENDGVDEIENFLMIGGTINNTSAVLFNRAVISRADVFDRSFRYIGDKYAFVKVLSTSRIAYCHEPLNFYRDSNDSSPKHTRNFFEYCREHFFIFDWIDRNLIHISKSLFLEAFFRNTETSLISGWNRRKVNGLREMLILNPKLFRLWVKQNLKRSFRRLMRK